MKNFWANEAFIIAEAGVNHNGNRQYAFELIDAAVDSGVNAVKFQSFFTDQVILKSAPLAEYQKNNMNSKEGLTQYDMVKPLELSPAFQKELKQYAESKGIMWFSTAFDLASVDVLSDLDIGVWKIPSGEITNYPYLKKIANLKKPVIISTGMCNLADIEAGLQIFLDAGHQRQDLCILHCNTEYPTPWQDVNLQAMPTIGKVFGTYYGYSDHTNGIEIPVAAIALGAKVIEKHFTLDKNLPGPDHKASLEPAELKAMVASIRHVEQALGSSVKQPSPSEIKNKQIARKSLIAATDIAQGELFSDTNLTTMRPGTGISPMHWNDFMGQPAKKAYVKGDLIEW